MLARPILDFELLRKAVQRIGSTSETPDPAMRLAAVALVFRAADADLDVLMIHRAERLGDPWSGHFAFPGGHWEPEDSDLLATARRETFEEIGLDLLNSAELLGPLSAVTPFTKSGLSVKPFIFGVQHNPLLQLSPEVQNTLWIPVSSLLGGARQSFIERQQEAGLTFRLPAWQVDGGVVWGLSYRIMRILLDQILLVNSVGDTSVFTLSAQNLNPNRESRDAVDKPQDPH